MDISVNLGKILVGGGHGITASGKGDSTVWEGIAPSHHWDPVVKFQMQNLTCWCILRTNINETVTSWPVLEGIAPVKLWGAYALVSPARKLFMPLPINTQLCMNSVRVSLRDALYFLVY